MSDKTPCENCGVPVTTHKGGRAAHKRSRTCTDATHQRVKLLTGETKALSTPSKPKTAAIAISSGALDVKAIAGRVAMIQAVKAEIMKPKVHFGKIPGCGDKDVLLKPGAEVLNMAFQTGARIIKETDEPLPVTKTGVEGHRLFSCTVEIFNLATDKVLGQLTGRASTMESKHRWRKNYGGLLDSSNVACPECGMTGTIARSRFGNKGLYCWKRKKPSKDGSWNPGDPTGCNAKWDDPEDPLMVKLFKAAGIDILTAPADRTENTDPADQYNTCSKIAFKRGYVGCTVQVFSCSDIFDVDLDDMYSKATEDDEEAGPVVGEIVEEAVHQPAPPPPPEDRPDDPPPPPAPPAPTPPTPPAPKAPSPRKPSATGLLDLTDEQTKLIDKELVARIVGNFKENLKISKQVLETVFKARTSTWYVAMLPYFRYYYDEIQAGRIAADEFNTRNFLDDFRAGLAKEE